VTCHKKTFFVFLVLIVHQPQNGFLHFSQIFMALTFGSISKLIFLLLGFLNKPETSLNQKKLSFMMTLQSVLIPPEFIAFNCDLPFLHFSIERKNKQKRIGALS